MAHRSDGPASSLRMFGHVHWAMCGGGWLGGGRLTQAEKYHLHGGCKTVGDRHVVTRTTLSREPKAKVVFRRKTTFALNDHKTSLSIRVWLRVHTEVYTEVKQLGPGGRRGFDV